MTGPQNAPGSSSVGLTALSVWARAYRVELVLFTLTFLVLAGFSSQRFLRQSGAPHFVYQAKAWLDGRQDIDADVLPNIEDWACVRLVNGAPTRCEGALQRTDRWYSSFPWFPSVVMLPFVAVNGYQLNDTSFGVIVAALAIALLYSFLRLLTEHEGTAREPIDNAVLALLFAFGSVFFYAAIRGEVWFSAEVMGVALTALYLRNAVGARRPILAGLFWSMAVMTRTPLFFTGIFFVLEALVPTHGQRHAEWKAFLANPRPKLKALATFAAAAAPLGLTAVVLNVTRFGSATEFGHRFFYNNIVNRDIDTWGLFHPHYLARNFDAAFLMLPTFATNPLRVGYDVWGMSLFITLPVLALAFVPSTDLKRAWQAVVGMAAVLVASALMGPLQPGPGEVPVGHREPFLWLILAGVLVFFVASARTWLADPRAPRMLLPVLVTLVVCMAPGLAYQNTGRSQFGFRFSLDYTPYVIVLLALGRWDFKKGLPLVLAALSVAAGVWGAVGFRGFTEQVYHWP